MCGFGKVPFEKVVEASKSGYGRVCKMVSTSKKCLLLEKRNRFVGPEKDRGWVGKSMSELMEYHAFQLLNNNSDLKGGGPDKSWAGTGEWFEKSKVEAATKQLRGITFFGVCAGF